MLIMTVNALHNDLLPTITAPVLNDWQDYNLLIIAGGGNPKEGEFAFGISAYVTSAEKIPEPTSILLLSLGLIYIRKRK
jgi:hypothetical protein